MSQGKRPISPFMLATKGQLANGYGKGYKFQITSVMSFLHRLSGISLVFILLVVAAWLIAAAGGPNSLAKMQSFLTNWFVMIFVVIGTFAACYHFCNGIRHLFWDMGRGLTIPEAKKSAALVQICAPLLAIAILAVGFFS